MNHARRQGHRVHAALYDRMTGPLEQGVLGTRRSVLLADLPGEVLDVGAGTGANLPHFRSASPRGRCRARPRDAQPDGPPSCPARRSRSSK